MRRVVLLPALVLALATALSVGSTPTPPASASCAGPWLDVEPRQRLATGSSLAVTGRWFLEGGCQDSTGCSTGPGCGGPRCEEVDPPPTPQRDVVLRLEQGGRSWSLGVADAADDGTVTWRVLVPTTVREGPARLVARGATRTASPVRISRS